MSVRAPHPASFLLPLEGEGRRTTCPALTYHSVTDDWTHPLAVNRGVFRRQLDLLAARGYRGVTLAAAATAAPDDRVIALTFDDAFRSVFAHAAPLLDELGWQATVYAVTDAVERRESMSWLGGGTGSRGDLTPMTWDELAELARHGWEVGSHSRTHRLLSTLPDTELFDELEGSRRAVTDVVGACAGVSYPWGEVNARVVSAARRCGYEHGSGLAGRFLTGEPLALPRLAVSGHDGDLRYRLKVSPLFWRVRSSGAWDLVERGRHAAGRTPHR